MKDINMTEIHKFNMNLIEHLFQSGETTRKYALKTFLFNYIYTGIIDRLVKFF